MCGGHIFVESLFCSLFQLCLIHLSVFLVTSNFVYSMCAFVSQWGCVPVYSIQFLPSVFALEPSPWLNSRSVFLCFVLLILLFQSPRGLGEEQAVAGIWPAERGLCEGNSGQNVMAGEGAEQSQSGPLTAAQWGPFRWWARGTVGSGHSPLGQQGATDCHNKVFKMSRLPVLSPLLQNMWLAMHWQ